MLLREPLFSWVKPLPTTATVSTGRTAKRADAWLKCIEGKPESAPQLTATFHVAAIAVAGTWNSHRTLPVESFDSEGGKGGETRPLGRNTYITQCRASVLGVAMARTVTSPPGATLRVMDVIRSLWAGAAAATGVHGTSKAIGGRNNNQRQRGTL